MTDNRLPVPDPDHLRRRLRRSNREHAFVHERTGQELASRLDYLAMEPLTIVDLGAMHGQASIALARRYPAAQIIAIEPDAPLCRELSRRRWWLGPRRFQQLTGCALDSTGLADGVADLVVANLSPARMGTPDALLAEAHRILREDGVFLFATPGPDSLLELRQAWTAADRRQPAIAEAGPDKSSPDDEQTLAGTNTYTHTGDFVDMHDFGDALTRAGFREPVLDTERITVHYDRAQDLWRDISASGARNCLSGRATGLMGKNRFSAFAEHLNPGGNGFDVSLELVYGHCFAGGSRPGASDVAVPVNDIRIRRR